MDNIDLSEMSLQELKALERDVTKAIKTFEDRQLAKARAELQEHARRLGFNLETVLEAKPQARRSLSKPKYRNPDDPEVTWTGRGRKPRWFVKAMEAGVSEDSLKI